MEITNKMSAEHRHCDQAFADAEAQIANGNWEQGTALFKTFHDEMEHHFALEEEILFPTFEQTTGMTMGPTQMMRSEHVQMRDLLQKMAEACEQQDQDEYLGLSETLLIIMQQHNAKEEQILYPMTDQALSGHIDDLLARMEAA